MSYHVLLKFSLRANSFAILTGEIFVPYGYTPQMCGVLGSTYLLVGLLTAIISAPILDRVFKHHLALVSKIFLPSIGVMWLGFIWAVKANNLAGIFVLLVLLGAMSVPMLPVGLELACELTRNADGSSALLWFQYVIIISFFEVAPDADTYLRSSSANMWTIIIVEIQTALTASPTATPVPYSMHKALVFSGIFTLVIASFTLLLDGKQTRRAIDEKRGASEIRSVERGAAAA